MLETVFVWTMVVGVLIPGTIGATSLLIQKMLNRKKA